MPFLPILIISEESNCYHCDPSIIAKVAEILGVSKDEFQKIITRPATPKTSSPASSLTPSTQASRASSPGYKACPTNVVYPPSVETLTPESSLLLDNVNRLAVNLYTELLSRLVSLINRSIQPYGKHAASIILFDSPGFQNPNTVGEIVEIRKLSSLKMIDFFQEIIVQLVLLTCVTIIYRKR